VFGSSDASGGASAGTRKRSLAHAPRSTLRQRSLQNGRHRLAGAKALGVPQVGQGTRRTDVGVLIGAFRR